MANETKTSTVVSGRGLNKKTTTSTTTVDKNGNSYTTTKTSRSMKEKISIGGGLFGLIAGILLAVSLIKSLLGANPITFGALLETLASAPSVNMSMTSFDVISPLQWEGIFAGLAGFLNIFITIFNVLIFAFKGISQVILYVVWFLRFLFA